MVKRRIISIAGISGLNVWSNFDRWKGSPVPRWRELQCKRGQKEKMSKNKQRRCLDITPILDRYLIPDTVRGTRKTNGKRCWTLVVRSKEKVAIVDHARNSRDWKYENEDNNKKTRHNPSFPATTGKSLHWSLAPVVLPCAEQYLRESSVAGKGSIGLKPQ